MSFSGSLISCGLVPSTGPNTALRASWQPPPPIPSQEWEGPCQRGRIVLRLLLEKDNETPAFPPAPERSRSAPEDQGRSRLLSLAFRLCDCRNPRHLHPGRNPASAEAPEVTCVRAWRAFAALGAGLREGGPA